MSDSDDDFVEVSGYQSSGSSDWERIDYSSETEEEPVKTQTSAHEIVQSYYNPENPHTSYPYITIINHNVHDRNLFQEVPTTASDETEKPRSGNRHAKQARNLKEARKKQWTKVLLKRGQGAPYDPVEFLGITAGEKALLSHFGITTIEFGSSIEPDKFAVILDLQERAYVTVTEYVTRSSSQPEIVWGYLYLGDAALASILKKGYMDSDSLYFLWTPMPSMVYPDQLVIDNIVGKETKNSGLRDRYSRFVKINLSKLCNKYYGRLYNKDPNNITRQNKWMPTSIMEAAELSQREDLWCNFEPGNDIYSTVPHGSIVIPTGRISKDCLELDKATCAFSSQRDEYESEEHEHEETSSSVAASLDYY